MSAADQNQIPSTQTAEASFSADMSSLKQDMNDLKSSVKQIADAVTKLAILEDRQAAATMVAQKTLERLEKLEEKQHAVELRIATGMLNAERMNGVETKVGEIATRLAGYEAAGRTASTGIKAFWAVFGGALTSALIWMIGNGSKVSQ